MPKNSKETKSRSSLYRAIAATVTIGGVSLLSPMMTMAQTAVPPTAAGTAIDNTATGTYEDPNVPGQRINATSNKVTAIVAEIAGVTNTTSGTLDINLGSVTTNDGLDYSFLITNVGNAPGAFHIPTATDITIIGGSLGTSTASIPAGSQRSANIFVTAINGVTLPTAVALPLDGFTNNPTFVNAVAAQTGFTLFDGSVPAGGSFKVVVPVTVTETQANQPVSVQLGNTGATFLQNVDRTDPSLVGDV
ncbi:MAG: hypothetical protein LH649_03640 [Pseudanabaena sp. CAN_BIN31]|nr:hypothetical protein [Pseudanabaena sp. CAN_BIN31]